ncbi:alpha/beta hydrolase family protein [Thermomonospora umbrina]|uniref:Platelet-activating factor acetylhydrolase isoform II n=1 Tax=Thermomonospora umbrina TaxID=111806 RepID=A0A3D9SPN2_9ACTN|nr:alpha/beta hydrolase [Thermomonospora umbrina]REE97868.1 platelet-activating factor acetylhydrolase isoform II [Thermomonospora umbrina]
MSRDTRGGRVPVMRGALAIGLVACAGSALLAPAVSAAPRAQAPVPTASPADVPRLPEPTGPHPVGTTALHLKDSSRPDQWVPTAKARELMVSLWYPTKARRGPRSQYMTPKESELFLKGTRVTGIPYDALSTTVTHAIKDAEPAGPKGRLPLVVLSPGFTMPRVTLTALAEELASRGYVVAGIDHTYENHATTFPDGRIATCVACDHDEERDFGPRTSVGRAADVSFVLDELTGSRPEWRGSALIDASRIAMVGKSIGGAAAMATMIKDPRVRAGINMDGTMYAPIPQNGMSRPFMYLGAPDHHGPGGGDRSWDRDWPSMTGWKRWLTVTGSRHQTFTDLPVLAEHFGHDLGQDLTAARSVEITRAYVRAFVDLHLRHRRQPLLNGPSARFPEVRHCTPETKTCA